MVYDANKPKKRRDEKVYEINKTYCEVYYSTLIFYSIVSSLEPDEVFVCIFFFISRLTIIRSRVSTRRICNAFRVPKNVNTHRASDFQQWQRTGCSRQWRTLRKLLF